MERLFQADFHVIAQVGPAPGLLPSAAAEGTPEDRFENVAQIGETAAGSAGAAAHPAVLEGGMAKPVISRALLRVFQAIVSFADRLEPGFRLGIAGVAVRMEPHRQLAIGRLDRRIVGRALNLEQFVIIGFYRHRPTLTQDPSPRCVARRWDSCMA